MVEHRFDLHRVEPAVSQSLRMVLLRETHSLLPEEAQVSESSPEIQYLQVSLQPSTGHAGSATTSSDRRALLHS